MNPLQRQCSANVGPGNPRFTANCLVTKKYVPVPWGEDKSVDTCDATHDMLFIDLFEKTNLDRPLVDAVYY